MRVFVFSDSHGNIDNMQALLSKDMPDALIHLGDHVEDAEYISDYFSIDVYNVAGNSFEDMVSDTPESCLITLMGHKIYLCHGHVHNVKLSYLNLSYAALEHGASVALFGHTHLPCDEEYNGVRLINPGSVARGWRGNTYAELIIDEKGISCTIKDV